MRIPLSGSLSDVDRFAKRFTRSFHNTLCHSWMCMDCVQQLFVCRLEPKSERQLTYQLGGLCTNDDASEQSSSRRRLSRFASSLALGSVLGGVRG